jgi:hypothetical protein
MTVVVFAALVFAAWRNNADKNDKIAGLSARVKQVETDALLNRETMAWVIHELRERLDRVHGHVIHVNHERREVLIDIAQSQGARTRMKMWVFASASPGAPNDGSRGMIELSQVDEPFSTASFIQMNRRTAPIRVGDIVISPFWSPKPPARFALIGKVDMNRDRNDDRDELKHLIQVAGGVIDFDLPPPGVGKQTGTLSPSIDWYVIDEVHVTRDPSYVDERPAHEVEFERRKFEAIKEARLNGIRPMPTARLLAFLDCELSPPEAASNGTADKGGVSQLTVPHAAGDTATKAAGPPR